MKKRGTTILSMALAILVETLESLGTVERRAVMNRKRKIRKSLFWGVFSFVVGGIGVSHAAAQSAATCVEPPSGLVSWWPLDETSGSTTTADIVDSNPGAVTGGLVLHRVR